MGTLDLSAHGLVPSPGGAPIPDGGAQTIAEILDAAVAQRPDGEALVGRNARFTYAELDAEVGRATTVLADAGIEPGDRVAASLPNITELVVACLATARLGAVWVGINTALAPPEKQFLIDDAGATVFLATSEILETVTAERTIQTDASGRAEWHGLVAAADPIRPGIGIHPDDPAAIAYTSGTSGFPKGAVHTHHNVLVPSILTGLMGTGTPDHRFGVCLPLTILNLMALGPLTAFRYSATLVCMDRIDPVGIATWVREERIRTFAAVPAILHDLLTHPDVSDDDLVTLDGPGVGGANCPEEFKQFYEKRFGKPVAEGYGMTEAPTAVTFAVPGVAPAGSVGTALPQVQISVVDDDDTVLAPGQIGEICVSAATTGPYAGVYTPMLGYWNKPDETARALRNGKLHTGDIGYLDEDGFLFLKDRRSDLIIRGGANVYPAEVERVLHSDPRVAACAVLGVADERLGERVAAAVQLEPGSDASADELLDLCRSQLARYKVPDQLVFVAGFPRTPMNKIIKRELHDLFD